MSLSTRAFAGFVLIASAIVLGTALLSQYWGGLVPCELCLLQRWPWAAAVVISLVLVLVGGRARLHWVARRQSSSGRGCMTSDIPGRPPYLPGDRVPEGEVERMIRVDHAGEYGAVRIYEGQLAVMRRGRARDEIRRMAEQEARHLATFNQLMQSRQVRPTVLQPLWHMAGFALGAATALLGEEAAMACTVAVEEVIDEHYRGQAEQLGDTDPALKQTILAFRDEELAHRQRAIEHGAMETLGYDLISGAIKTGSRLAIWLSTRI